MKRAWIFSPILAMGVSAGVGLACGGVGDLTIETGTCASGKQVPSGGDDDGEGMNMAPGRACIACHSQGEGPRFSVAGTVFVTSHVINDCQPTSAEAAQLSQAQVVITDSAQQVFTLDVTSDGNFAQRSRLTPQVVFPITAKVVYQGKERSMLAAQTSGDCNSCHTDQGTNGAPGRVALPD